jgi:hypothetical protein
LIKEGRMPYFDRYNDQIIDSKMPFPPIYMLIQKLLLTENKMNFRKAYDDLIFETQQTLLIQDVLSLMDNSCSSSLQNDLLDLAPMD